MKPLSIGILAYHGDIIEHQEAIKKSLNNLNRRGKIIFVRTKKDTINLDALIIPGGESTVIQKLTEREGIVDDIKKIKNIFGTCAGAIILSKIIHNKAHDQKTLELMDIELERNAYGRQNESFEKKIDTTLGTINAVFIRAPRIKKVGKTVRVLSKRGNEVIACEQKVNDNYYLATCFHPELTTTVFHEYFINNLIQ